MRGDHDKYSVVRRRSHECGQKLRPLVAGLAGRQPHLDDTALGKQRHVLQAGTEIVPVETAFGDMRLAFCVALGFGCGAYRVEGLVYQQGLVTGNEVYGCRTRRQMRFQLAGSQLHTLMRPPGSSRWTPLREESVSRP